MNALRVLRFGSELSGRPGVRTPIRGVFVACYARADSGHVTAAPPISLMNSRRLMFESRIWEWDCTGSTRHSGGLSARTRHVHQPQSPSWQPTPRVAARRGQCRQSANSDAYVLLWNKVRRSVLISAKCAASPLCDV